MKINFPIISLTNINNQFLYKKQNYLKPMLYDTFEKTSFCGVNDVGTSPHSFEIKNIKNLRCPVCGLIMLTDEQINQFVNDVKDKRGYDLVEALEKYEDDSYFTGIERDEPTTIFRPLKQEIVDIIKDLALQFPRKTLTELVDYEAQRRLDILIVDQMKIVDELEAYLKKSSAKREKKEAAYSLIEQYRKEIRGEGEQRFSRKRFIYDFSNIAYLDAEQKKINEITEKLPTSKQDVNSWFVKYSKSFSSSDIARKLVQQSIPSADHLVPKSKDGANSLKNYLCDCSDCNSARSNTDFEQWMHTIPNFKENLQQYLQDIQNAIDGGVLVRKYNNYIDDFIETIKKLSSGQIILDAPKSTDNGKRIRILQARKEKLDEITKYLKEQTKMKKEKQAEIEMLVSHPYYQSLFMLEALERNAEHIKDEIILCADKDKIAQLKSELKDVQERIDQYREDIANSDNVDDEVNYLKSTINAMQYTQSYLDQIKEQIEEESAIRAQLGAYIEENINISIENSQIIQSQGFDESDTTQFDDYIHLKELIACANSMTRNLNSRNRKEKEREVVVIALNVMIRQLAELSKKDEVRYFTNKEKMKENKAQIEALDKKLDEIEAKKVRKKEYERNLRNIGRGKTIEQLQERLDELVHTREIIAKIHSVNELKEEYKHLCDAIKYNKAIFHLLKKNYETMTNEEFIQQVNSIY